MFHWQAHESSHSFIASSDGAIKGIGSVRRSEEGCYEHRQVAYGRLSAVGRHSIALVFENREQECLHARSTHDGCRISCYRFFFALYE